MPRTQPTTLKPKRRFPAFRDQPGWEADALGNIATIRKGKGVSKGELAEDGTLPCIRYAELYTRYGEVIEEVACRTNVCADDLVLSKKQDVIIPASGETKIDIATAACVMLDGVALGSDLNILRSDLYGPFFSYYLNGSKRFDIAKLAQGDTVAHLYPGQLEKVEIAYPTPAEQRSIADCLGSVDAWLAAAGRKLAALRDHKRGLMQQLFPQPGQSQPQLRFPDFKEGPEWEMTELGSLSDVRDGTHDSPKFHTSGIPLVTSKNLMPDGTLDLGNVSLISFEDYEQINKRSKVNVGDILFGMIGTIGNPVRITSDGFAIKNVALIKELSQLLNEFVVQILQSDFVADILAKMNTGNSQKFVALGTLRKLPIPTPSLLEQQKIAACLTALDTQITAQAAQIESLKTHKHGLMQQLFPSEK